MVGGDREDLAVQRFCFCQSTGAVMVHGRIESLFDRRHELLDKSALQGARGVAAAPRRPHATIFRFELTSEADEVTKRRGSHTVSQDTAQLDQSIELTGQSRGRCDVFASVA